MEECVSSLMEERSWRSIHLLFACERLLAFCRSNRHQALMNCISSARLSPTPCFIEMVLFGMPVGLGLGRDHEPHYGRREGMVLMPYDPLWVGQLAGLHTLEGQDCGTGGRSTGYSLCKGSIPLGGSPRLLSVTRALLP